MAMSDLVRFGVSLEEPLLRDFDRLIDEKGYGSRSEAFRDLIRDALVQADWTKLKGEQVATLTLVYNHEYRELTDRLTDMQHDSHSLIVCSTHVHLTAHTCLEAIVLRGEAAAICKIADKLIATRGVQHGKLTMTTLGRSR
jgi:CopG family nickel-responsive transcriptional regulator